MLPETSNDEDHRALDPRHADDALRPGQREHQDRQAGEDERRGIRRRTAGQPQDVPGDAPAAGMP